MEKKVAVFFLGVLALAWATPGGRLSGQAIYGGITGIVTDPSGAAVPNARVIITAVDRDISVETTTNETGHYQQTHLIVGTYRVRVEAPGFQAYVQENVRVNVDAVARVDASLQVGAVTQTMEVTAEIPMLKTERADVATTFDERYVQELPLLNRNFTQFQLLTPGSQRLGWQHAASENPQGSIQIMMNGQHFSGTAYQLDGTDNRDPILGIIVINPNFDSISEAKVTSQNYDAEFGQATAGVVTAQTRSGTNEIHGSAFWFRRDNNTSARNPFSQSVPIFGTDDEFLPNLLRNQIGGSLGGPIRRNKTFIFGDYQATRITNGGSVLTRVPTAAERAGDLSGLGTRIFNPRDANGNEVAPANRQEFAGGVIPAGLLSPQAQNLLRFIPLPNVPGATGQEPNFSGSGTETFNSDSFNIRADHWQTDRLHLFGRYSYQDFDRQGPGAFGDIAGGPAFDNIFFAGQSSVRNQSIAAGFDFTVSPTLLTDFRFGFYRYRVFVRPNGIGTTPAADAGIPGLNLDLVTSGMPAFFINGVGGFTFGYSLGTNQCNCPLDQEEQQFQFVNNWTNIRGNHTLKFGADVRYAQNLRVPSDSHRAGELSFNPQRTQGVVGVNPDGTPAIGGGLGIAAFLLGDVSSFRRFVSSVTDAGERQWRHFLYAQDTIRLTPKLTLSAGLRWEIYAPQRVTDRRRGGFLDPSTGEVLIAGSPGIGLNGEVSNTFTNFAPRFGLAYQVTPATVIRVGYGRSFDVGVFGSLFGHSVTQNLPVLAQQENVPGNPFESVFSLAGGPQLLDPGSILADQVAAGRVGETGRPLLPDGVTQFVLPFKQRVPTVDAWHITIQRQLTPTMSWEVAYVGNKGTHVFAGDGPDYDFNQPSLDGFGVLSTNERKPFFQRFGWSQSFRYFGNDSDNNFNSLQTKFEKRFSSGYQLLAHYTWARAFNHDSSFFPIDRTIGYGPTDWQRDHVFVLNNLWELPFGRGKKWGGTASRGLEYLIGGWQINAITTWSSGLPFTPSFQDCGAVADSGPCRVNVIGDIQTNRDANRDNPTSVPFFTTTNGVRLESAGQQIGPFERPQPGTIGNATRNSLHGPRFFNTDLSVFKNFVVTERVRGQFRAEWSNIWNNVNLGNPDSCVDCGNGGKIFGLAPGANQRQLQFALRFEF